MTEATITFKNIRKRLPQKVTKKFIYIGDADDRDSLIKIFKWLESHSYHGKARQSSLFGYFEVFAKKK